MQGQDNKENYLWRDRDMGRNPVLDSGGNRSLFLNCPLRCVQTASDFIRRQSALLTLTNAHTKCCAWFNACVKYKHRTMSPDEIARTLNAPLFMQTFQLSSCHWPTKQTHFCAQCQWCWKEAGTVTCPCYFTYLWHTLFEYEYCLVLLSLETSHTLEEAH